MASAPVCLCMAVRTIRGLMLKELFIVVVCMGATTVAGSIAGVAVRTLAHRWNDVILGFSAGVMLSASTVGLLAPAFGPDGGGILLPLLGAFLGAALVSVLDCIVPHLHTLTGLDYETHKDNRSVSKGLLFVAAIALHKLPEGLAAGVGFGTGDIARVASLAGAISLQNLPEAFVIAAPLLAIGVSAGRIMLISLGIACVSMVSVLCGYLLVSLFAGALPFLLAAAGGAMLYVISDEVIPETHSHGFEKSSTFALLAGFLLVLAVQRLVNG